MNRFGESLLIDMYNCKPGRTDDLEFTYRFLDELVHVLKMTPMSLPTVYHGPTKWNPDGTREDVYGDKSGVSAWQPLIESGIQIHTINDKSFVSIDIYTCGELDISEAVEFCVKNYEPTSYDLQHLFRGKNYF